MQHTVVSRLINGQGGAPLVRKDFNDMMANGSMPGQIGSRVNIRPLGGIPSIDPAMVAEENENLRLIIEGIKNERSMVSNTSVMLSNFEEPTITAEIQQAALFNNQRILELEAVIRNQHVAILEYQKGFLELEANIDNLRVLDSDIYKRLSEHDNTQFETKVIEVKKALHSNAPYEILLAMLNDIRI